MQHSTHKDPHTITSEGNRALFHLLRPVDDIVVRNKTGTPIVMLGLWNFSK